MFFLSFLTVCLLSIPNISAASTDNQEAYQTAAVYFLPDYSGSKEESAEARGCNKLGYSYSRANCASPRILRDKCPVGNKYKECYCAGSPTCTGSTSSANPYSSSSGASRSSCVDCPGKTLYTWTCSRQCAASVSSKPSNSSYTTCRDCSGTYNVGWTCNSGYYKSGSSCVCATSCSDKVTTKPANSSYTTTSCSACGISYTIKTGWTCNAGYHKSGSSCEKDCEPLSNETGCAYGSTTCSDGCGGTRKCCKACLPMSSETGCSYGTYSCSNGCGGTRKCCSSAPSCTPQTNETNCTYGTYNCSDGCGGTRKCCLPQDPTFWCCLPGDCDYESCYSRVGKHCDNNPSRKKCTDYGGTPRFEGCVGPDYGPFTVGNSAGSTPSHNGAQFDCDF